MGCPAIGKTLRFICILAIAVSSFSFAYGKSNSHWLLGYEAQVESAISLALVGSSEPSKVTDNALETAIIDLANVSRYLESRLDSCTVGKQTPTYCSAVASNGKAYDSFRRKILARRALITFFRNFLIQEFNKRAPKRNFANALRMGQKIKNI